MAQSLLFLKYNRDAYVKRFVKTERNRAAFEGEVLESAFDYLRAPRQNLDVDMVREMHEAVGEFHEIGNDPVALTARAIFAAVVLDALGEARLRADDEAYRPDAVKAAFRTAILAGIAAFDSKIADDHPARQRLLDLTPGVKDRLAWQAYMAWRTGEIREAVRAFPDPAYGSETIPSWRPVFLPVDGILMNELWKGLLPPDAHRDWQALFVEMADAANVPVYDQDAEWWTPEVAERPQFASLCACLPFRSGAEGSPAEIVPLAVKGREDGCETPVAIMNIPFLPQENAANQANTTVRVWNWHPWRDGVAAEAWMSLANDVTIFAVVPHYCYDKSCLRRGMPCSAQLAFFMTEVRVDTIDGEFRRIGRQTRMDRDFTFLVFVSREEIFSHAWYGGRALVEGVREAKMWNGDSVMRLELRMRDIPFAVPSYVHPSNCKGGIPKAGDAVMLVGWFCVDMREILMSEEEYRHRYPDGIAVPEDKVPGHVSP